MNLKYDFPKKPVFMIFIVLLVSFAVYFNALSNGFVYDDKLQVLDNGWIKDIKHIPEAFSSSAWSFMDEVVVSNYYRPLMHVIYLMDYHIFGLNPWGFHLVNIMFHVAVSVLVFILLSRLIKPLTTSLLPPFTAALLFAAHPIHTEAVTWVSGITEPSYTFFYLFSFYFYIRSMDGFKTGYLLSLAAFSLSALCKETALTLPIILIAYDYSLGKKKIFLFDNLKRYIPFFIIVGIYLVLRFNALGGLAPQVPHVKLTAYEYAINIFPLFAQYLYKLLLPINLNAFYVLHPIESIFEPKGIVSIIITIVFVALSLIAFKKNKTAFTGLLFISVPLLPVLYIPGVGENVFTERYLYLPSLGFVILVALLISRVKADFPKAALTLTTVFILISGLYSIQTIRRNHIWKDDYILFKDTVKKSPDGSIPRVGIATALLNKGIVEESIEQFMIALTLDPKNHIARYNLGIAYFKKGWTDKAIEQYELALKLKPSYADAHKNLGVAYRNIGLLDKAIEQYNKALSIDENDAAIYYNMGNAYADKGALDKAIELYRKAIGINRSHAEAYNNLGTLYSEKGWIDLAIEQFKSSLELNPDNAFAHNNLGNAYMSKGLIDKAIEEYRTALTLSPDNKEIKNNLDRASALMKKGRGR